MIYYRNKKQIKFSYIIRGVLPSGLSTTKGGQTLQHVEQKQGFEYILLFFLLDLFPS